MAIINIKSAAGGAFMVTLDGRDLPESEYDLAISAPGLPNGENKTAKRISENKFLVKKIER